MKEVAFHMEDLGRQVREAVEECGRDEEGRRCKSCGEVVEMVAKGVKQP